MSSEPERPLDVFLTVDVEPDCPPYLDGWKGIDEGLPAILELFAEREIAGTFFTTGQVAEYAPDAVRAVVDGGHELAGHGHAHRSYLRMGRDEARADLARSTSILRSFAPVVSFRAPYLELPHAYLALLAEERYRLDSSTARYKRAPRPAGDPEDEPSILRVPASVTSSVLRVPGVRDVYLRLLGSPMVLFVHPWEMVDLRSEPIRWDCRFRTGETALADLASVIDGLRARGARFRRMDALLGDALAA